MASITELKVNRARGAFASQRKRLRFFIFHTCDYFLQIPTSAPNIPHQPPSFYHPHDVQRHRVRAPMNLPMKPRVHVSWMSCLCTPLMITSGVKKELQLYSVAFLQQIERNLALPFKFCPPSSLFHFRANQVRSVGTCLLFTVTNCYSSRS
jgi:hypothetical protein